MRPQIYAITHTQTLIACHYGLSHRRLSSTPIVLAHRPVGLTTIKHAMVGPQAYHTDITQTTIPPHQQYTVTGCHKDDYPPHLHTMVCRYGLLDYIPNASHSTNLKIASPPHNSLQLRAVGLYPHTIVCHYGLSDYIPNASHSTNLKTA